MRRRTHFNRLGQACALALLAFWACTDNPATRVIETVDPGAPDEGDDGPVPPSTTSTSTASSSGGSGGASGGAAGAGADASTDGTPVPDDCLPECDDPDGCELTPLEQAEVDFCHLYKMRCPDQPSDVMLARGPGEQIPTGGEATSTPARPQLSEAEADDLYTIRKALAGGGVYTVDYSGEGGAAGASTNGEGGASDGPLGERTVSYADEDDWDPRGDIEDVDKIVPGLVVDPEGNGTYTTIQAAIGAAVVVAGCPRVFIKVMPGTYHEKITVPAKTSSPPVTIYTTERDASKTVIVAGHSAAGDELMGTPLTIHTSATFTNSLPRSFQLRNLTVENNYVEGTWPGDDQAAVALLNQGDKATFDNVRVLGNRNSAYVKSTAPNEVSRAYFRNCYIEGDEEIILGRGTAVFDQCEIHSLGSRVSTGSVMAPSTRVDNPHGFLLINSELTADEGVSDVYLGRQWYEGDQMEAVGKVIVRNSILGAHIRKTDPWAPVVRETPLDPLATQPVVLYDSDDYYAPMTGLVPPEAFLSEFGNSGPGAAE